MSILTAVREERERILGTAHLAIMLGIRNVWSMCVRRNTTPEEPDFVAGLVLDSTPIIYDAWGEILSAHGIQLSTISVYCHQVPRVRYLGIEKAYCEVGDILLAHFHRLVSGVWQRNALLYQVKVSSDQPHRIGQGERHQLRLYTELIL